MNRPCPNRIICAPPDPGVPNLEADDPVLNFSSEATDGPDFPALVWPTLDSYNPFVPDNPNDPPTLCDNPVSQTDSELCAQRNTIVTHSPPGMPPPSIIFASALQSCPYLCPDGSFFIQRVAPGAFSSGTNQASADEHAAAFACLLAAGNVFCVSGPEPCCCNTDYTGHIVITGGNGPFSPSIVGSLPPGLGLSQSADTRTIFLKGTVATPGTFPFTLIVADGVGNTIQKLIKLIVLCVQGTPPNGQFGVPYSFQFTGAGGVGPYSFRPFNPGPPTGLALAPDGTLSGTPQTVGTFTFGVGITDSLGNQCGSQVSITLNGVCNNAQHGVLTCPGDPSKIASITIPAGTFCGGLGTNQDIYDAQASQALMQQIHDSLAAQGCVCPGAVVINGAMTDACGAFWVSSCQGNVFIHNVPFNPILSCDTFIGNALRPRTVTMTIPGAITIVFHAE